MAVMLPSGGQIAGVGKARGDAVLGQRVCEQVVGAAVQRAGRDDVVARFGNRQDGVGDRGLARGQRQRGDAAFQRRHALLQHVGRGVHDAGIDVARHLQIEQVGAMLRIVERVGNRLIDGHGNGARRRIGAVAAMHGNGFQAPIGLLRFSHVSLQEMRY
ncbi:hypothetical protein G6F31_019838 [Rhizopus arrhizus]|nr:hypothetical protein G6F31_019838 [Rhizopus arrhizus]